MIYGPGLMNILQVVLYIHLSILSSDPLSLLSVIVIVIEMEVPLVQEVLIQGYSQQWKPRPKSLKPHPITQA